MDDFVTFEISKKLEEKGFKEKCFAYYDVDDNGEYYIDAPTISQILKWLREEKKIYVEPCILADTDTNDRITKEYPYWSFSITNIETGDRIYFEYEHIDDKKFDSYEQAALAGIEYVIDNLI